MAVSDAVHGPRRRKKEEEEEEEGGVTGLILQPPDDDLRSGRGIELDPSPRDRVMREMIRSVQLQQFKSTTF